MKNIVKALDIVIAVYFIIAALLYGIIPIAGYFAAGTWWDEFLAIKPWWARIILVIILFAWIYAPYYMMQKAESKYNYCLAVLVGVGAGYKIYELVVLNNYVYQGTTRNYLAFFIIPIIVIIITYYLHHVSFVRKK